MRTPQEFRNEVIGKAFDQDGAFKYQCWDGADKNRVWLNQHNGLGCPQINCTDSGYVRDIWNQRHKSGILNYFVEVPVNASESVEPQGNQVLRARQVSVRIPETG